jgi:hypothetical protein
VLKHCAANRKRRLSALPNVGPYIYHVKISGFARSSIHIYDISRLRVKGKLKTAWSFDSASTTYIILWHDKWTQIQLHTVASLFVNSGRH